MSRHEPKARRTSRTCRLAAAAAAVVCGVGLGLGQAPVSANGFFPCADPVMDFAEFQAAVAAYVAPGSTCTAIRLGADIDVVGQIDIFAIDEMDTQVPVGRSLTIFGDGHWLVGDGATSSLVVDIDDEEGDDTFAVVGLGMRNFAGSGALSIVSGKTIVDGSRFVDNAFVTPSSATGLGDSSAGAVNAFGDLSIFYSEFVDNTGSLGGAIYSATKGTVYITSTTFARNSASTAGGAAYIDGSVSVLNSTFTDNVANTAGALNVTVDAAVEFSTIVDNTSSLDLAAVSARGSISVSASIVYGNVTGPGSDPVEYADVVSTEGVVDIVDSLVTTDVSTSAFVSAFTLSESNIVGEDPRLERLGDHGGFELPGGTTISTRPPRSGSPVIDQIELADVRATVVSYDQRGLGFERYANGFADMGAVEYRQTSRRWTVTLPEVPSSLPDTL